MNRAGGKHTALFWTYDAEVHPQVYAGQITASASVSEVAGEPAVIFNGGRTVYSLAAADGRELWRHALGEPDTPTEIETAPRRPPYSAAYLRTMLPPRE